MKDLSDPTFEPFAAKVRFSADQSLAAETWKKRLCQFLERLARACEDAGAAHVGHIKAIALFGEHLYLKASALGMDLPALAEGNPPDGFIEMTITLNVLVFGLPESKIESIASELVSETIGESGIRTTLVLTS